VLKACPGPFPPASNHPYDAYQFKNGPSNVCITVTLTAPLADFFSAAYLGSFVPTDICSNYLADAGNSTLGTVLPSARTYSFNVPPNTNFIVIVNGVNPGSSGSYTLDVHGSDCPPDLKITQVPANKVVLDWTTAAPGFSLETTNDLAPGGAVWPPVPIVPLVVNGRFTVTNNITTSNQFFRLRKPLP
jgi:hypothetical protein